MIGTMIFTETARGRGAVATMKTANASAVANMESAAELVTMRDANTTTTDAEEIVAATAATAKIIATNASATFTAARGALGRWGAATTNVIARVVETKLMIARGVRFLKRDATFFAGDAVAAAVGVKVGAARRARMFAAATL